MNVDLECPGFGLKVLDGPAVSEEPGPGDRVWHQEDREDQEDKEDRYDRVVQEDKEGKEHKDEKEDKDEDNC